ncbi:MAG: ABC transporter ATP-binding protein [Pseudomonadota bacterium]
MPAALRIGDLSATLLDQDRTFTLDVPELEVAPGEAVGLSGPSGTGKTLILEIVGLLRQPSRDGHFTLLDHDGDSVDIGALWQGRRMAEISALRGRALGFIPQSGGLLPFLSLRENIALSQRIADRADAAQIAQIAKVLDIEGVLDLRPEKLSIGQRQRGAIARALAHRPSLIVADEPTASLDPATAQRAMALIADAAALTGSAVLISSHDLPLLAQHTTRGYSLALAPGEGAPGHVVSRLSARQPAVVA